MFGKMFVQEVRNSWRVPVILSVVAIVLSALAYVQIASIENSVGESLYGRNGASTALSVIFFFIFAFYLIVTYAIMTFYMPIRFYREAYSDMGYLYHSLPVKKWQFLLAHALCAGIWMLIYSVLLMLCSAFIYSRFGTLRDLFDLLFYSILQEFRYAMETNGALGVLMTILAIASFVVGIIASVLRMYCAISLGQIFQKHRIAGAVLMYFLLGLAVSLLNQTISMTILTGNNITNALDYSAVALMRQSNRTMIVNLIVNVAECVAFWFVTTRRMTHHLNLE